MVSLSDLNGLLEKIPMWKRLIELPRQIEALETRVKQLEAKLTSPLSKNACPSCGERTFFVTSSRVDKVFKDVGGFRRTYTCKSCGFSEEQLDVPDR